MRIVALIVVLACFTLVASGDPLYFPEGSEWKYLDDGSDQGTAWKEVGFDDSRWGIGPAQLGFGEGDEATPLEPGFICYYFRKIIDVEDISNLGEIYFEVVHDDGMVLYINGVEIVRSALMPQTGEITYLTGTSTYIPNADENSFFTYPVDDSCFVQGENTIAFSVHNQNESSSDVSFDCRVVDRITHKLDGPYVFYRHDEIIVKTVEVDGPHTYTYTDPASAQLICRYQSGADSFAVELKEELVVEESTHLLPQKFLATSDIEGNIDAFVMLLRDAGVMNDNHEWIFGEGHLYFLGDMFDRGENVTECLWLLYKLETEAVASGGDVHFVLGNHEIMNLIYDFRYVGTKYFLNALLMGETLETLYATDTELGRWLRTKNLIEKVDPLLFVHAGVSPTLSILNISIDEMNYWGRFNMDAPCSAAACYSVNGSGGLFWYRGMAEETPTQEQVDAILDSLDVDEVIIGHTEFDHITFLYEDRVVCIDLDHADNYQAGFMEALYFENGEFYNFHTDGTVMTYTYLKGLLSDVSDDVLIEDRPVDLHSHPNPFYQSNVVSFSIPEDSKVDLIVCDVEGRKVKTLINNNIRMGEHTVTWNGVDDSGESVNSGVYFYKLNVNGKTEAVKECLLLK